MNDKSDRLSIPFLGFLIVIGSILLIIIDRYIIQPYLPEFKSRPGPLLFDSLAGVLASLMLLPLIVLYLYIGKPKKR